MIALVVSVSLAGAPADREGLDFFERNIRPVLVEHCYSCHSSDAKIVKGGFLLDSRTGIRRGGDLGSAVVPGDAAKSGILRALRYDDADLQMPPKGRLSARIVRDFEAWIEMGAPDPRDGKATAPRPAPIDWDQARQFWSFRPVADPPAPDVQDSSWPRSDLDRFVLARLESRHLKPRGEATRRALIRRLSFGLTGLPPSPDEIASFLGDERSNAYELLVERLLASPRYGERWGRHWLDVARYADSNGLDENIAYANAFRYRDWVIEAWNDDQPYDDLILWQLAGDLLGDESERPDERRRRLIATGFLSIGPKMLACDDGRKMELDIVDEQVDTTSRAFMALTMGCARCHDHKFDPLPTSDYYSLAGIFKSTKTMENFKVVAHWHEHEVATAEDREKLARHAESLRELSETIAKTEKSLADSAGSDVREKLASLRESKKKLEGSKPAVARAMGVRDGKIEHLRVHLRGSYLTLGDETPRGFPRVLQDAEGEAVPESASGREQLARWLTRPGHPLTARVMVNRLWQWHFENGLVRTPDNFGRLGERPTHPELLDWLAARFVESGWSIKAMHRLLLTSSTYRQSADFDEGASRSDPENRLLWRFPRRRLTAEEVRDSILHVGGKLDLRMYGQLMADGNRSYVTGTGSKESTYDFNRRSIYMPILRSAVYQVLQTFDFADPSVSSGKRAATTVAPQALYMMNGKEVLRESEHLARQLLSAEFADDRERILRAFEICYARLPDAAEIERMSNFAERYARSLDGVAEGERRLRTWQGVCRVLIAANEFIYLD